MDKKPSSNVSYFVGVLFFVVAWRIAPGAAGGHGTWYILSALLAFAAMSITLEGVRARRAGAVAFCGKGRAHLVGPEAACVADNVGGADRSGTGLWSAANAFSVQCDRTIKNMRLYRLERRSLVVGGRGWIFQWLPVLAT